MSQRHITVPRIKQIDASLDKPLDKDAPPTIYQTTLKPEFATAALNLSVDFLKQQQGIANKYLIFHPFILMVLSLLTIVFLIPTLNFPHHFNSVSQWLYHLFLLNKRNFLGLVIFIAISTSFIFTILSRLVESYFKFEISKIIKSNGLNVFNVDLSKLNSIGKDKSSKNTSIIVYRNTPVALVSMNENNILSDENSICMVINTIGCRKVYLRSGLLEDLIDWTMINTKKINDSKSAKNQRKESLKLIIEVFSFDDFLKQTLKKKGFNCISKQRLNNRILGGLFGLKKELWGVQFRINNSNNSTRDKK